ncbi:flagellar brake protein [Curvibacter sp. CHRR-16]|uniref:flagellar brake protein n=1 Tax=Curvibacter sp. CHRR-16 TaxID=2835872 RepID=UPI001BDA03B2|nr:flagellar brake protein [Curvibacter sp. CHRR-16]MBT0569542.1 flagellar brake protein [Curvibacter sp. CHRR-16]
MSVPDQPLSPENDDAAAQTAGAKALAFADIGLPIGSKIQIEPPASLKLPRVFASLLGYWEGLSLLITMPRGPRGELIPLLENETLVMRAFVRQAAFAFAADILRVCRAPYPYLHLTYPSKVTSSLIRKYPRVRCKLVADVFSVTASQMGQALPSVAVISNISASGALVDGREAIGGVGDTLQLQLQLPLHGVKTPLTVQAVVRVMTPSSTALQNGQDLCHFGVEFVNLTSEQEVLLKSFVYQKMVDEPKSMV